MQIEFIGSSEKYSDTLILPVWQDKTPGQDTLETDQDHKGLISQIIEQDQSFTGALAETAWGTVTHDGKAQKLLLVGLGAEDTLTPFALEKTGGTIAAALQSRKISEARMPVGGTLKADAIAALANGYLLRSYAFDKYRQDEDRKKQMQVLTLACGNAAQDAKKAFAPMKALSEGVHHARDLANEPPNALNPDSFAKQITDIMKPLGVKVKIIDSKALMKMGAGAIMGVGQGSETPPCFVVMEYAGAGKAGKSKGWDTALVGKGITFDTGGYSLKPPASQIDMKFDMCGAAAVVGAMAALGARQDKVNAVGIVALAENMVSSKAYRVNDVITSLSGKTVEVLNTDAEGRLVLADALTYIQQEYNPDTVIDLATLTGAAMVALGCEYGAVYSTDDALFETANTAAKITGEKIWRMPLDEIFDKEMKGEIADLRNIGKGRWGGSCTAAAFLKQFVDKDRTWMHMDIAGTPYSAKPSALSPAGGNGYGVRLLVNMLTGQ